MGPGFSKSENTLEVENSASAAPPESSAFLSLPPELLERILEFVDFQTVAKARLVCRKFRDVAHNVLEASFNNLRKIIREEFQAATKIVEGAHGEDLVVVLRRRHLLQILQSEVRLLRAVCWRYVRSRLCCFFPVQVLERFHDYINLIKDKTTKEQDLHPINLCDLSQLNEAFVCFFESNIETGVRNVSSLSTKVVDLLDCYLVSEKRADWSFDTGSCHFSAEYEFKDSWFVCESGAGIETPVDDELRTVMKCLRCLVAWSNESFLEDQFLQQESALGRTQLIIPLSSDYSGAAKCGQKSFVYRRCSQTSSSDLDKDTPTMGMKVHVDLHCTNQLLPFALQSLAPESSTETPRKILGFLGDEQQSRTCDLILELKIDCPVSKTQSSQYQLKVVHSVDDAKPVRDPTARCESLRGMKDQLVKKELKMQENIQHPRILEAAQVQGKTRSPRSAMFNFLRKHYPTNNVNEDS